MSWKPNPRVIYTFFSLIIILLGTLVAIEYAKGGFRLTKQGIVQGTGLLLANSFPAGAEVRINDDLVAATDETLYLKPDDYKVRISKEGYSTWEKTLSIQPEIVTSTNAVLFPQVPSLTPLTISGVTKVLPSPDGQKILFFNASASATANNGLYVLELTNSPLFLQRGPSQVVTNADDVDLAIAEYIWSPDSNEVMIIGEEKVVVVPVNRKNNLATLPNQLEQMADILSKWQEEMYLRERQFLTRFPNDIIRIASESATNVYFSPDKKRLLYTATTNSNIPPQDVPQLPGKSTQTQARELLAGHTYVYDREEDTNFLISNEANLNQQKILLATDLYSNDPKTLTASPSAFISLQATNSAQTAQNFAMYQSAIGENYHQWYPDSKHLIFSNQGGTKVVEYDGTNETTIYSGPFADDFIFPWPDGSRLVVLTSFSPNSPLNLYAIELK